MPESNKRPQTESRAVRGCALALLTASLTLLAGCPANEPATQAATPANATAPALPAANSAQAGAAPAAATPAMTPAQTAEAMANAQKAQLLINKAEQSYRSGVQNYEANRLDAARMDFDYAVDSMLSSGLDLKNDPQLADEFDHLLNAINSLEIAALKQGNGLTPKLEATPLDAANGLTFTAADPALTAKLKSELDTTSDLPLVINDQVAGYINAFANSPAFRAHMRASLQRAGKYREMIQKVLAEEGVPQDLIYLAVAESGFQPQVVNAKSGCGGMWQFAPTGAYGLVQNGYFDERFDPEKSSRAYAKYIKSLYNQLGDWYLAMAGYNWGPGNIQRAVMRTGYADFWELYKRNMMPAETKAYVPQFLAAIIMAKNPEKYGLDKMVPDKPVIYDTITVDYAIDLRLIADVTEVSVAEIAALNPSLLRMTTPRDISFDLHLPAGTKQLFLDRLKDIPEDRRASWRFHIVKPGETVESIAAALHGHAAEIATTNGISSSDPMEEGDELVVPVQLASGGVGPQHYTVRRGDTLVTVADSFNVSVEDLRRWNNLSSSSVRPGRTLYVSEPVRLGPSARGRGRRASAGQKSRGSAARGYGRTSSRSKSERRGGSQTSVKSDSKASQKGHASSGSAHAATHGSSSKKRKR
ncbi:LysM peptidoglycan-binding domain-containing protein [Granulicella sp. WH15]|uniref:lytic transglycosylase domain-containing protein n=1 Tax=Granulicella sp. WH15 TaxID=2602070 RepID=UPI0013677F0C|nr:lytic transglycosylase domain-containing protein [Granulicella sp. WH15]QHN05615.1 LysM peptidoglycan-binding domain-containing protein [Granulicella sp. WH15]